LTDFNLVNCVGLVLIEDFKGAPTQFKNKYPALLA